MLPRVPFRLMAATGPAGLAANLARGFLMGAADVVPGVSGGTVALVVGIYERLVRSIRAAAAAPVMLARGRAVAARARLGEVEWTLVLPLAVGIVTALVVGAATIRPLMEVYPEAMRAVFFGMIAASLPLPWSRIGRRSARALVLLAALAVVAFFLVGLPDRDMASPALGFVFVAAMVAICAMILPGVSGAFLLLVMGMYEPTLDAVHTRDLAYIATFAAGAAVGISFFASLLRWLLVRARDITMAALVGLMVGSLRALWPFLEDDRSLRAPIEGDPVVAAVVAAVAGLVVVLALATLGDRGEVATRGRAA
jgi:putative membrane protein